MHWWDGPLPESMSAEWSDNTEHIAGSFLFTFFSLQFRIWLPLPDPYHFVAERLKIDEGMECRIDTVLEHMLHQLL